MYLNWSILIALIYFYETNHILFLDTGYVERSGTSEGGIQDKTRFLS